MNSQNRVTEETGVHVPVTGMVYGSSEHTAGHQRVEEGLTHWGWNSRHEAEAVEYRKEGLLPGRVIAQNHHVYLCRVFTEDGGSHELSCRVSGAYIQKHGETELFPVTGDWVMLQPAAGQSQAELAPEGIIHRLLPRTSALRRAVAGEQTREQLIVANLDYVLLVFGLDGGRNFLESMLERSLTVAWNSGAQPVVVLNKADFLEEEQRQEYRIRAEELSFGVPVFLVSARTGEGIAGLAEYIAPGSTMSMLGKSGVGKSALINALMASGVEDSVSGAPPVAIEGSQRQGDLQGRHTTTSSRLYRLPWGALAADVPGLRELKIWGEDDDLLQAFPDIRDLGDKCRFRDCTHGNEPGCAVQKALEDGSLDRRRYLSYLKLQRELEYLHRRQDEQAARGEKLKWKQINKQMRNFRKPGRD